MAAKKRDETGAGRTPGSAPRAQQPADAGSSSATTPPGEERSPAAAGTAGSLLPALTLPTGGGAIRGIGEKFQVNAVTGTAALQIPLPASPGRGGQGPQVALSYSSGAGNGAFGLGFTLSVPSISRKTDKGLPRYIDDAESDTYVWSEAEDLVPVLDAQGLHIPRDRTTHFAFPYRPRIEGSFARIERWVDKASREVHWRVTTPDNITRVYGIDANCRIADPNDASRVYTWLLKETRDDKGNVTRYDYKAEDGAGVDPGKPSERSRFDYSGASPAFSVTAQRYLKRVLYGNAAPGVAGDFLFELVFDYGDHAPATSTSVPTPAEAQPWPVRQDAFSSYRSGFEVRTYRLCRRVLMFHRLNAARDPLFVRATELEYEPGPKFTYLTAVVQAGYKLEAGVWQRGEMPRLALRYQRPEIQDELTALPETSLEGLAGGADGARKQWIDLDGEGIPGLVVDHDGGWFYKENRGNGELGHPRPLRSQASAASLADGRQTLEDLDGDGRLELVSRQPHLSGYFPRSDDGQFDALRPFTTLPNIDWNDPNLRLIDLDGDGHGDVLITEDQAFVWYRSRTKEGFDPARRVAIPFDENDGPRVIFADAQQSIQLADMSGDGLTDIVRIRNGSIVYWPNLGHGRFGAKIVLENSPVFAPSDEFHASRVRLADVDGSGTTDLVYLGSRTTTLYFNEAGNRLADGAVIHSLPPVDALTQLSITDLLGTGTSCLVWTSSVANPSRSAFYVDLLGSKKPHLLIEVDNNLGAVTRTTYASSTKFYLEDKKAGIEWLTRLPFPVQVVERMERTDAISGGKLVSRYRYRHGFFDGVEREFRGFARVEQLDAEDFAQDGTDPLLYQPPVRTVSWFHTGAWLEKERLERGLQREYFQEGPPLLLVKDTILPSGMSVQDEREAARALKGSPLRQETYADDGSPKAKLPYVITEKNQEVRLLQKSRGENRFGVFFAHERETVTVTSERNLDDARVGHGLVLDVDDFGTVRRSASIVYGRAMGESEQRRSYVTLIEVDVVHQYQQDDVYRLGTQTESRSFEVTGLILPSAGGALKELASLRAALDALVPADDLDVDQQPTTGVQRRLLGRKQQTFYTDDAITEAAFGFVGRRALPYRSYQLALTAGNVAMLVADSQALTGTTFDPALLVSEGKYQERDGQYWSVSGRAVFSPSDFYQPTSAIDPFGNTSTLAWDEFKILPTATTDALLNVTRSVNDYRVLVPSEITDTNLNRVAVAFDALGMVIASAVMGKAGAGEGDTLADPTTRLEYDLLRYQTQQQPAFVHTFAREQHGAANPRFQETFAYSDGFGRVAMTKAQAEPGPGSTAPRWVGTGRTVFNNKGNPVKQYEPYFSATSAFEAEDAIVATGVTPIIRYDSIDRVVRTDFPDGTFAKVEFDSWSRTAWDQNDTVLESQWYLDRGSPAPSGPEPSTAEARAAWLTAQHAATPTTELLDSLGRPFLTDAHNRTGIVDEHYRSKTRLDVQGNVLAIFDAKQIKANATAPLATIEQHFDVLQRSIKVISAEAGTRVTVADVTGKPLRAWDSRRQVHRQQFDALRRPSRGYVRKNGTERLLFRTLYGESLDPAGTPPTDPAFASPAQRANLRGRAVHVFDCAGVVTSIAHDFKGNLLSASRRISVSYQSEPDWGPIDGIEDASAVVPATLALDPPLLQSEVFTTSSTYDALSRVVTQTAPDGSATNAPSVTRPTYNEANLLDSVFVSVRGATESAVVSDIEYNARGQRIRCTYINGTVRTYEYDPQSFRLVQLTTLRGTTKLQQLLYSYDAVGNITDLRDLSDWDPVLNSLTQSGITGSGKYRYDAIYRLVSATGRELPGPQPRGPENEPPRWGVPHGNDLQALERYREELTYDEVGNILQMRHFRGTSNSASWSRRYDYFPENNRLRATSAPGDADGTYSDQYGYLQDASNDAGRHGSVTSMPHLALMEWDYADRLKHTLKSSGSAQDTYFTYDASGQRVRKVYHHNGLIEERIYLGGYEVYRRHTSGLVTSAPTEERQTLHVMDDESRVAIAETKTRDADTALPAPVTRWRFQLDNHLGSAALEVDLSGNVITYEEYHPYGGTAFHTADGTAEVSAKRYRYTGKEKDDETGLYYHGARYYAPWLGRWTAADPAGLADGLNVYRYSRDNPINFSDPGGTQSAEFNQRHVGFESNINLDTGEASYSITVDLRNTDTGDAVFATASGGPGTGGVIAEQLATFTGIGANLSPEERDVLFQQLANFEQQAAIAQAQAHSSQQPGAIAHAGPALERGVWGRNFRDRGYTLEHLYNNDIPNAARATGDNRPNYDVEDPTHVKQIKSSNAGPTELRKHASKATRDAAQAIQDNPSQTMAGKRAQAVVITPTDAPATAGAEIRAGYDNMRTPIPNSDAPEHVRGLPGVVGTAGKVLTVGGTVLSGVATAADLAAGDYPMAAANAVTTAGGAMEVYGIAAPGATVLGVSAVSAGMATAGVGIAAGSAISGVRSYQKGDTAGAVAGAVGVVAGVAMVAGVVAGAPVLLIGGVVLAAGVGAFHLVRYLSQ